MSLERKNYRNFQPRAALSPFVIPVLSGKGGVGKSVIALNLGAAAARQGYRCLIIDADWYFGNIHILANAIPSFSLADIITGDLPYQKALLKISDNLDFIAAPSSAAEVPELDVTLLEAFIKKIRNIPGIYDFIIIDTPSGDLDIIRPVVSHSGLNLVIIMPELTSIADGYGLLKYLVKRRETSPTYIFINRADSGTDCEYIYQKLTVLTHRFLGLIPRWGGYLLNDRHVTDSVACQRSIVETAPNSSAAVQIVKLFNLLSKERSQGILSTKKSCQPSINSEVSLAEIKE
jgi:flagellar biosynthesis protein FlhG